MGKHTPGPKDILAVELRSMDHDDMPEVIEAAKRVRENCTLYHSNCIDFQCTFACALAKYSTACAGLNPEEVPEMLASLKEWADSCADCYKKTPDPTCEICGSTRALIAKAEGRA